MRWSYKTIHFQLKKEGLLGGSFLDVPEIEQVLNDYGRAGWELVSIVEMADGIMGVLKQPIGVSLKREQEKRDEVSPALKIVSVSTGAASQGPQPDDQQAGDTAIHQSVNALEKNETGLQTDGVLHSNLPDPPVKEEAVGSTGSDEQNVQPDSPLIMTEEVAPDLPEEHHRLVETEPEPDNKDKRDDADSGVGSIRIE